ncbi:MAG: hypothetical protein Q4G22_07040 [Paracoccus sp. (in: a-proteobacteria)]|uniref:polysaccharide pyruvyl transferase family protein n=1 Tax=Paracoccus sp. TaxID=267 RepID=UPI0026DF2AB0|nr:polysaccharide pyruvyl transferase family protein [Paracoccus sp. (in: a-proteobacteria)]MDO5631576.1 hypothetical protein [Paracoccus sp. (in: a-proteobacteria)]
MSNSSALHSEPARRRLTPAQYYHKPARLTRLLMRTGLLERDQMFWWWPDQKINFGDWVGPLIYEWRTGRRPLYCNSAGSARGQYYLTAGSILSFNHQPDRAVVWGSGVISDQVPISRPKQIHAVRGPMTRQRYLDEGFDCPDVYGDPGILVPHVLELDGISPNFRLGIIPHFSEAHMVPELVRANPDIKIIDVLSDVETVSRQIADCAHICSSSLHGLIITHALNRPAAWIRFSEGTHIDGWKFQDYYRSGRIEDLSGPSWINAEVTPDDLIDLARRAPRPDTERLMNPLLQACPF